MGTSGAESVIAAEVEQFQRASQDISYAMRCWSLGALLDRRTQGWSPARIDELLRTIVITRAWAHPLVHRGAMVFISYSGKQAELARRLAGSLQHRGVECVLDRYELELDADDTHVECWIAESLMKCHVLIHIVSGDVQNSGWVHRESEWQRRLLGLKSSLVLPYLIVLGDLEQVGDYPRCRVIPGSDLVARWDPIVDLLAARIALDWLLAVKAGDGRTFGIAYEGKSLRGLVGADHDAAHHCAMTDGVPRRTTCTMLALSDVGRPSVLNLSYGAARRPRRGRAAAVRPRLR